MQPSSISSMGLAQTAADDDEEPPQLVTDDMLGKPLSLEHVIGASIFNESREDREARGKAECTSAAV